jgi:hypothetical protein
MSAWEQDYNIMREKMILAGNAIPFNQMLERMTELRVASSLPQIVTPSRKRSFMTIFCTKSGKWGEVRRLLSISLLVYQQVNLQVA